MDLRTRVVQGGAFLIARQAMGVAVGFGGVILLTRLIGPSSYGLYTGALAIILFLQNVGRFGLDVYLLRSEGEDNASAYHQAFTYLLLAGIVIAGFGAAAVSLGIAGVVDPRYSDPLLALLPTIPLTLMSVSMTTQLERRLEYRGVALIELSGQLAFYAVSISMAIAGYGLWAPVAGYWIWQSLLLLLSLLATRYRPRLVWHPDQLRDMLSYGFGYSSAAWLWQLRGLVNPLIVGSALGPAAVAHVNLAIRLVELLSMVKTVLWRLSLSVLGRVQNDMERLRTVVMEGMWVQVISVGIPIGGVSLTGPWLIPLLFGDAWRPVARVLPLIGLSYLVNAMFNMHSSVLYVFRDNARVAVFHVVHIALFALSALTLVPRYGVMGYGVAELLAFPSYWVIHRGLARRIKVSYNDVLPWLVALAIAISSSLFPWPWSLALWMPVVVVVVLPRQRRILTQYAVTILARGDKCKPEDVNASESFRRH